LNAIATHGDFMARVATYFKGQNEERTLQTLDWITTRIPAADLGRIFEWLVEHENVEKMIGIRDVIKASGELKIVVGQREGAAPWPVAHAETCPACGGLMVWKDGESDLCKACQFPGNDIITRRMYVEQGSYPMRDWFAGRIEFCRKEKERKGAA
jgi:hypothetical protein